MSRILIAEDEKDIRELITITLQFAGFEVISTANGEEALEKAMKESPDLLLLDVRMPRMNGYDVCRHVKSHPKTRHIPVVFLSAKGQESEVNAGIEAGAEAYILKPFSPDQLIQQIRVILKTHGAK